MSLNELLTLLDAGGNVAMIGLLFIMWKFDRRLFALELHIQHLPRRKSDNTEN